MKQTVYRFGRYDITSDKLEWSRRMATADAAARLGCIIEESSAQEVDAAAFEGSDIDGVTAKKPGAFTQTPLRM